MTPFQTVHHICIAVEDVGRAMSFYESIGIGPWHDYPPLTAFTELDVSNVEGFRALTYKWAMVGELQLQLVAPGNGSSPQRDFLDERGPGVYHVGFVVEDANHAERAAHALGLRATARGRRPDGSGFTYFDTRSRAGVTLEIRQSPPPDASNPRPSASRLTEPRSERTPFGKPDHACVVVSDIRRAVAYYKSIGIGPWHRLAPTMDLTELAGVSPDAFHDLSTVWAPIGRLQLHLVQPGGGRAPQSHFLAAHGEGVFHIGFAVGSVDDAEAHAAGLGLTVGPRGRYADGSGFSYLETYDSGGVMLQLHQPPTPRSAS